PFRWGGSGQHHERSARGTPTGLFSGARAWSAARKRRAIAPPTPAPDNVIATPPIETAQTATTAQRHTSRGPRRVRGDALRPRPALDLGARHQPQLALPIALLGPPEPLAFHEPADAPGGREVPVLLGQVLGLGDVAHRLRDVLGRQLHRLVGRLPFGQLQEGA